MLRSVSPASSPHVTTCKEKLLTIANHCIHQKKHNRHSPHLHGVILIIWINYVRVFPLPQSGRDWWRRYRRIRLHHIQPHWSLLDYSSLQKPLSSKINAFHVYCFCDTQSQRKMLGKCCKFLLYRKVKLTNRRTYFKNA